MDSTRQIVALFVAVGLSLLVAVPVAAQAVTPDSAGHYQIQLGASLSNGLPAELFSNGQTCWFEVQIPGKSPQPRAPLVGGPSALKAAVATTLGRFPASSFVLAGSKAAPSHANLGASR